MDVIRGLLERMRNKRLEPCTPSAEALALLYKVMCNVRVELVESFYNIAERRLRSLYDDYAAMMLKFDKLAQLLRRLLSEPMHAKYPKLSNQEIEEKIYAYYPLEVVLAVKSLLQSVRALREASGSVGAPYLKALIRSVEDSVEEVARGVERLLQGLERR